MKKPSKRARDNARSALSEYAVILSGALYTLGLDTHDENLKSRFNVSLVLVSNKLSASGLISLAKDMIKAARENIDKLKKYTVTPEFLSSMESRLDAFEKTVR